MESMLLNAYMNNKKMAELFSVMAIAKGQISFKDDNWFFTIKDKSYQAWSFNGYLEDNVLKEVYIWAVKNMDLA